MISPRSKRGISKRINSSDISSINQPNIKALERRLSIFALFAVSGVAFMLCSATVSAENSRPNNFKKCVKRLTKIEYWCIMIIPLKFFERKKKNEKIYQNLNTHLHCHLSLYRSCGIGICGRSS